MGTYNQCNWHPETILFVVDLDKEIAQECGAARKNRVVKTRLEVIKDSLLSYVRAKRAMSGHHHCRLATITDKVELLTHNKDRNSSVKEFVDAASNMQAFQSYPTCNLEPLVNICAQVQKEEREKYGNRLRVVIVYSRSLVKPVLPPNITSQPKIPVDVLYLHLTQDVKRGVACKQKEIYASLIEFVDAIAPESFSSHVFEMPEYGMLRNLPRRMIQLLAHVSQRGVLAKTIRSPEIVDVDDCGDMETQLRTRPVAQTSSWTVVRG